MILLLVALCARGGNVSFVVGGAQKSGTTSLMMRLGRVDGICIHMGPEIHYWDWHYNNGLEWYNGHCFRCAGVCGEKSPSYMISVDAVGRMASDVPLMKWVLVLRDPVFRAYSHYRFKHPRHSRTFEEELVRDELHPRDLYISRGDYIVHIQNILGAFPRSQLHIIIYEEMIGGAPKFDAVFRGLVEFLGVDMPPGDTRPLGHSNESLNKTHDISNKTYAELTAHYAPYNRELEEFLGRSLPWTHRDGQSI